MLTPKLRRLLVCGILTLGALALPGASVGLAQEAGEREAQTTDDDDDDGFDVGLLGLLGLAGLLGLRRRDRDDVRVRTDRT